MTSFPPPPNPRFAPPPPPLPGGGGGGGGLSTGRFPPPPPSKPGGGGGFGAPPPPPAAATTATTTATATPEQLGASMSNLSVGGGRGGPFQPPAAAAAARPPAQPAAPVMFQPPAFRAPPPGPPGPPHGGPAGGGGGGGPTLFTPAAPFAPPAGPVMTGAAAAAAAPGPGGLLMQPAASNFYQPKPSEAQVNRMGAPIGGGGPPPPPPGIGAPGIPGISPGMAPTTMAPQPIMNDNIDFGIRIPSRMFALSASKIPAAASQAASSKIPFGAVLRPLAPPPETTSGAGQEEEEDGDDDGADVDTVQPGAAGIVRCKRCRTYINPFVVWMEHGRRWRCNICAQLNDCPSSYFCHLDEKGLRRDRYERPELCKGVVEFVAPAEYMVRPPQEPCYFFVLDVSAPAVRSGMLRSAASAIRASLDDLPGRNRTKIGFITFDNSVHYYNLAPDLASPQMLVVSDLKELFVPLPDYLLVNLQESRQVVETFLDNLPEMFAKDPVVSQSCLGPALKAAFTVMKSIGGKMCIFQSLQPNLGDGALKTREQPAIMGTPNEVKLLRPDVTWYKDTSVEFSRQQICVDMFIFPYQYMDLASLGELARFTAGKLRSYVSFQYERDGPRFEGELVRTLTQTTAFEAVMRIRCTKGMRISNFYGNFYIRGTDLLALPNCNAESVFGFDLVHEEQSLPSNHVTIQAALLYTSSDGERRIRVMTQALPVTSLMSEVVQSIDADACLALLAKQAVEISLKSSLDNARMRLQQVCVDILRTARGGDKRTVSGYQVPPVHQLHHAGGPPGGVGGPHAAAVGAGAGAPDTDDGGAATIPPNLELLPLYTLAMMKNVAFRGGNDVHPDERVQSHHLITNMWVDETKNFVYPRLFSLHTMDDAAGYPLESANNSGQDEDIPVAGRNRIVLPPVLGLSIEHLSSDGVYLLDNGVEMYLWVGRSADVGIVSSLFGVHSLDDMDPSQLKVLTEGDPFASRFGAITEALRQDVGGGGGGGFYNHPISPKINVVREGDAFLEARFFWFLIEDRASFQGGTHSYAEFMSFVNDPSASSGAPRAPPAAGPPGMAPHAMGRGPPPPPGPPRGGPMPPPPPPGSGMGMGGAMPPPAGGAAMHHPPAAHHAHMPPPPGPMQQQHQYQQQHHHPPGPPPPPQYGGTAPPAPSGQQQYQHHTLQVPPPPQHQHQHHGVAPPQGPPPGQQHASYGHQAQQQQQQPPPPAASVAPSHRTQMPAPPGRAVPSASPSLPPPQHHPHRHPPSHSAGYPAPPPPTNPQAPPRAAATVPPPPPPPPHPQQGGTRMGSSSYPVPPPPPPR